MAFPFNDSSVYKKFSGPYHKQMPRLITAGRTPLTVADVMRRRLTVAASNSVLLWRDNFWLDHPFDTSDAILYHPNGTIKIVRDAPPLRTITPQGTLHNGALRINPALYHALMGPEFDRDNITNYTQLTPQQVLDSPVWLALAGEDQSLLRAYADLVFRDAEQWSGYTENMAISLDGTPRTTCMRAWFIDKTTRGSGLNGTYNLDYSSLLVGVAPAPSPKSRD